MSHLDGCWSFVDHLRAEHRRVNEALRRISGLFRQPDAQKLPDYQPSIVDILTELRMDLAHHFREEESGGCIEEAVSRCPNLSTEANQVERQHPILLKRLDRVIETAGSARSKEAVVHSLKDQFDEFAAGLRQHESTEKHILQRAFGVASDIGE